MTRFDDIRFEYIPSWRAVYLPADAHRMPLVLSACGHACGRWLSGRCCTCQPVPERRVAGTCEICEVREAA